MKYGVFVVTLACVLSAAVAFGDHKVEQVYSDVMSYVQEGLGDVRMMRGSAAHLACYDDFIPLINNLANEAKENSQACINEADNKRHNSLIALAEARAELAAKAKKIQDSLTNCAANDDSLGYFKCLLGIVDEDKQILDDIASRSAALVSQYESELSGVDDSEQSCLRNSVEEAKKKSDNAFEGLKNCMAYGPSTNPTTSP